MPARTLFLRCSQHVVVGCFLAAGLVHAQTTSCAAIAAHEATPAEQAYAQGKYDAAESLYMQALMQKPQDVTVSAALVRTLLHEDKVADAAAQANKALSNDSRSAVALTALAEVQFREGQPWRALTILDDAVKADPCYARAHLIRSRILRIDSMYASERKELQIAYDIDPTDPDIRYAWLQVDSPAKDITGTEEALATMKDVDGDLRQKAIASVHALMGQLTENSKTCKSDPITSAVTVPLLPMLQDAKHVTGYQMEVELPKGKAKLVVDTAASGLYISRALADANGFQHKDGEPPNTVHADSMHIGLLEFRDCMIGVSEAPFPDKGEGFIGTDLFASYLVTLNFPAGKLELAPLPAIPGEVADAVPGDRPKIAALADYSPVYHRRQFLIAPVMLNKRERRLFVLDSGMRLSTMTPDVAHSISTTKVNFTNAMETVGGGKVQLYRDNFDFQFADLSVTNQGRVLEFDPAAIDESAGFQVAGMIGFDILHAVVMHLDYRDGLVKFDPVAASAAANGQGAMIAAAQPAGRSATPDMECDRYINQSGDLSRDVTIEASVMGWLDSSHAKVGQPVTLKVTNEWMEQDCNLRKDAMIYGKVVAASSGKNGGELAVIFDHADCEGAAKKALTLRTIGVAGPPGERESFHDAMPTELSGGGRDISQTASAIGIKDDENLNPGGAPHTVHPGIVVGLPKLKLAPDVGPECSALMTTSAHSVRLDTGSEFILVMEKSQP